MMSDKFWWQVAAVLAVAVSSACASATTTPSEVDASLSLEAVPVSAATVGGTAYSSSSRVELKWSAPNTTAVSRYVVTWTENATGAVASSTTSSTSITIGELKSSTAYAARVDACTNDACTSALTQAVSFSTPGEVWHLQGTGASMNGLRRIVQDGNVKLHAFRYGNDAPPELAGRVQLYYGPMQQNAKGLAVGVSAAPADAASPDSYLSFTSRAGTSGLISPATAATLVSGVATGQAVPLSATMGGKVRLYFEAGDATGRTRILSVDSRDGFAGLDFNSGASTVCSTFADYSLGGGCTPTVVLGVEGDAMLPNARIQNARQFKIGYPALPDWRWNGNAGTFMLFTTDFIVGCSTSPRNHGYAVWNGTAWIVQYELSGCPKLFRSMQAGHPLHVGGVRYKLYYGDPSDVTGRLPGSQLPFLGPKKLIYADGARTGDPTRVDFEDWEATTAGRVLTFLWPNGTALNATARGYIDDFSVLMPTANASLQVLYLAITDGTIAPFTTAAVLINP